METFLRCTNHHRWSISGAMSDATLPTCPVCGMSSFIVDKADENADAGTLLNNTIPATSATVAFMPDENAADAERERTLSEDDSAPRNEKLPDTMRLADSEALHSATVDLTDAGSDPRIHSRAWDQTDVSQTADIGGQAPPGDKASWTRILPEDGAPVGQAAPKRKRSQSPPWPPKPIAGYQIISALGRGAMGVVYMARHLQLDRVVALKMVLTGANASARDRARFLAEAKAVAQLAHPNILQIYEVGEQEGQPYFSLEYLEGGTLQEKLEKYSMPPREAAELIETLARALHYAHQKGILHRDIKPANVLMTSEGAPKFADFGLAMRLDRNEQTESRSMIVGTPTYMPPEQATGKADIGPAADIYSLGATLYEMIVGRPPFRGSTIMETLTMVKTIEPVAPRQLQPNVPADLQTICLKCLQKDPAQRYQTAEAFANDLRNFLEGRPIEARPVSIWEKTWKWARRNRAASLLIAVSCVSLLAFGSGGVAFAIQENQRAEEQTQLRQIAETQEQIAKDERQKAETQEQIAKDERKKAVEQRELAVKRGKEALENFQSAQAAVEVMVRVARNRMANEKHLETVGRELLENALVFYDEFRDKKPDDPAIRLQVARAQMMAGDLREKLGRYEQADQIYRQAERSYLDLLKEFPDQTSEYQRDLASVHINRATLLQVLNKGDEANEAFAKAKVLLDKNALQEGRNAAIDWMMGAGCNNRGIYLHQRGQIEQAEQAYRQGITLFAGLVSEFPRDPNYQVELAKTKTNLAYLWTIPSPGQPEKAEPLYQEAIDELGPVINANKDVPAFRKEYGRAYLNRGILNTNQKRFADADKDFAAASRTFEQLNGSYPGVADYYYLAATAQINLGSSKQNQKNWPASIAAYRLADERLSKLVADEPNITAYRHDSAFCTTNLAQVLEQQLRATAPAKDLAPDKDWLNLAAETERSWYLALDRWKALNKIDPGESKNAAELVKTYKGVNDLHKYLGMVWRRAKPAEAETQQERRVNVTKEMLARRPKERMLQELTGEALLSLALLRAEMKKHDRAAEAVEELSKLVPADSRWYPFAAGCLAQCLAVADKSLTGGERDKAVKTYGDRAIAMLEAAANAGWKDAPFLQKNPILQPLRDRPEYRARLDQLQKKIEREN